MGTACALEINIRERMDIGSNIEKHKIECNIKELDLFSHEWG